MSRILIVEDEQDLANLLTYNLSAAGFETETSHSGAAALSRAKAFKPDLVLLDLMLPGKDGMALCREIRSESVVPIVLLTARSDTTDVVAGLDAGDLQG